MGLANNMLKTYGKGRHVFVLVVVLFIGMSGKGNNIVWWEEI